LESIIQAPQTSGASRASNDILLSTLVSKKRIKIGKIE